MPSDTRNALHSVERLFRAVAVAVVPDTASFGEGDWATLERIAGQLLVERPESQRRQLKLFLRALDLAARVRWGHGLARLSATQRWALLDMVQRSRFLLLRRGVWGLRTLILVGYYGEESRARAIGYRATPAGWSAPA